MKVQVLQHVPFEGIGSMEGWLAKRGATVRYTRFYESVKLPDPRQSSLVIAMGGPMSVNDEQAHPWLVPEKAFLREAIRLGQSVIGICLGAQLIASALGARVHPGRHKEIGWFPVDAVDADGDVFQLPGGLTAFHWHGETFDLPDGAVRLAKSEACDNQAFQLGRNVVGLQFHLETTSQLASLLLRHCGQELVPGKYVQTEPVIRDTSEIACADINLVMDELLSYVVR
ncbi:MAG: amidotransferase [Verrucomicrobiota bacterium]|jgi:GMP synthase-like glutamine amidotransferase|nr:amidotransferase [Verrucomicrobiota bacterium]MDP7050073.1 amidotransferase [Verrucomicrobiota bacterium]